MKFLSTSFFRPLAFLGLLLVTATAFPTAHVQLDFTAEPTTSPIKLTTASLAFQKFSEVYKDVKELKDEMSEHNVETVTLDELTLPTINEEDGCHYLAYNWETCQSKIITGLLEFQPYVQFIQNKSQDASENEKTEKIYTGFQLLSQLVKPEANSSEETVLPSPTANANVLEHLKSQNEDEARLTVKLVLQGLELFLQESLRAIRNAESNGEI
ncbi:interleukin-6 [Octodon degus]|uniref:Interleukin-6 n=1 Tax=Octodon degus TaxID=10160 RepID=A0A6P3EVM8_OCTDE|nr:interleukin-6 [Octodon degus]